jgi:hypothetical protein
VITSATPFALNKERRNAAGYGAHSGTVPLPDAILTSGTLHFCANKRLTRPSRVARPLHFYG